jgi:hypothetical protein
MRGSPLDAVFISLIAALFIAICPQAAHAETVNPFPSFRDVPGITAEEIAAIEALQRDCDYFIFGVIPSSESFIRENGEVGGFTALFCEYLTELFGIPFRPQILPFNRLLEEFYSQIIDFTGSLTATQERLWIFFMTDPIAEFIPASMSTANPALAPIISVMNKALQNGARTYVNYLYSLGYEEFNVVQFYRGYP